MHDLIIDFDN